MLISLILLKDETKLRKSISLLLGTIFLIGQAPGLIFEFGGPAVIYFGDPYIWLGYFISSSLTLGRIQKVVVNLQLYPYSTSGETPSIELSDISSTKFNLNFSLLRILCLTLFISIVINAFYIIYSNFKNEFLFSFNTELKKVLSLENSPLSSDVAPGKAGSNLDRFFRFRQRFVLGKLALMKQSELGRIQSIANQLGNDTKTTVIYLPPDSAFWDSKEMRVVCWAKPFQIPTVTGMPMLNGVRSGVGECPFTEYYGMNSYTEDSRNRKLEKKELCQRAKKLGFSKVLEIDTDDYQLHSCNSE